MLLAVTVTLVASVAVEELPVKAPTKDVAVTAVETFIPSANNSVALTIPAEAYIVIPVPTVAFPVRVDTPVTLKFVAVKLVLTPVGAVKLVIVAAAIAPPKVDTPVTVRLCAVKLVVNPVWNVETPDTVKFLVLVIPNIVDSNAVLIPLILILSNLAVLPVDT